MTPSLADPRERFGAHPLRCPRTGRPVADHLDEHPESVVRGGTVLDLAEQSHYWNHLSEEEMGELLEIARTRDWRAGLDEIFRPRVDGYTYAYATDPRRADSLALCDLSPSSLVVDVGAGWGAVTCALAEQGHRTLALDSNLETLEFLAHRSLQEGYGDRVIPVRIDPLEAAPLPLEDGCADLLLLNGVLEWVGAGVETGSPRDHQLRLLREVHRVLRPEGSLYLAIESRWGISMFLGAEDHPKTRFTSVVPRWAASWMTRRAGKGPYRTWTHGYYELRSLLREAGFGSTRFYSPFPDYRFPHSIVPLDRPALFRRTIRRPGLRPRFAKLLEMLSYVDLHRNVVNHYGVVARS